MKVRIMAAPVALSLAVFGCAGDDDDDTAAGVAEQAFCEASAELDEQDGPPTDEQFDELEEVAPKDIVEEVAFVVGRFKEDGFDAFSDGEVNERIEAIEAWEEEHCPGVRERREAERPSPQEPAPDAKKIAVTQLTSSSRSQKSYPLETSLSWWRTRGMSRTK